MSYVLSHSIMSSIYYTFTIPQMQYRQYVPVFPDMAMGLGVSAAGESEASSSADNSLMLYYDHNNFLEMCSEGPNGECMVKGQLYKIPLYNIAGLAVYFYKDPLPNTSRQEDDCGDSIDSMSPPEILSPTLHTSPGEQHWLVNRALSVVKYVLFAAFVLTCNKLRKYLKSQRPRTRNSSSTSSDIVDVRVIRNQN